MASAWQVRCPHDAWLHTIPRTLGIQSDSLLVQTVGMDTTGSELTPCPMTILEAFLASLNALVLLAVAGFLRHGQEEIIRIDLAAGDALP